MYRLRAKPSKTVSDGYNYFIEEGTIGSLLLVFTKIDWAILTILPEKQMSLDWFKQYKANGYKKGHVKDGRQESIEILQ